MEHPENRDILLSRSILSAHGINWSSLLIEPLTSW